MKSGGSFALNAIAVVALGGCSEEQPAAPQSQPSGRVSVATVTTGGAFDLDGYLLVVDETPRFALDANDAVIVPDLPEGKHTLALTGVALNCASTDGFTRTVTVAEGAPGDIRFSLACSAPPELARIRILFSHGVGAAQTIEAMNADGSGRVTLGRGAAPDLSPEATKIAFTLGSGSTGPELWVMNSDGSGASRLASGPLYSPDWSPDGRSIAVSGAGGWWGGPISVIPAQGGAARQITGPTPFPEDDSPVWSPEGARIAFTRGGLIPTEVWIVNADGTDPRRVPSTGSAYHAVWSPDGQQIAYRASASLVTMRLDGASVQTLLDGSTGLTPNDWSGDGGWLLLTGDRGEGIRRRWNVYLLRLADRALWRVTASEDSDGDPGFWVARAAVAP